MDLAMEVVRLRRSGEEQDLAPRPRDLRARVLGAPGFRRRLGRLGRLPRPPKLGEGGSAAGSASSCCEKLQHREELQDPPFTFLHP